MGGRRYRAKTLKDDGKEKPKGLEPTLERNRLRNHRGTAQAWPLRVLQPYDRGPVQGRKGRSTGGRKAGRPSEGHLAYVPAYFCLTADAQRRGHRDSEGVAWTCEYQRNDALCAF